MADIVAVHIHVRIINITKIFSMGKVSLSLLSYSSAIALKTFSFTNRLKKNPQALKAGGFFFVLT